MGRTLGFMPEDHEPFLPDADPDHEARLAKMRGQVDASSTWFRNEFRLAATRNPESSSTSVPLSDPTDVPLSDPTVIASSHPQGDDTLDSGVRAEEPSDPLAYELKSPRTWPWVVLAGITLLVVTLFVAAITPPYQGLDFRAYRQTEFRPDTQMTLTSISPISSPVPGVIYLNALGTMDETRILAIDAHTHRTLWESQGQVIAFVNEDRMIVRSVVGSGFAVVDTRTGEQVKTFSELYGLRDGVIAMAVDNTTAGFRIDNLDEPLWSNPSTPVCQYDSWGNGLDINSPWFMYRSFYLNVATGDTVFSACGGQDLYPLPLGPKPEDPWSVFRMESEYVAPGDPAGTFSIALWDLETDSSAWPQPITIDGTGGVLPSSNGTNLALLSVDIDRFVVQLYSLADGSMITDVPMSDTQELSARLVYNFYFSLGNYSVIFLGPQLLILDPKTNDVVFRATAEDIAQGDTFLYYLNNGEVTALDLTKAPKDLEVWRATSTEGSNALGSANFLGTSPGVLFQTDLSSGTVRIIAG
jgi:hypothetical protein